MGLSVFNNSSPQKHNYGPGSTWDNTLNIIQDYQSESPWTIFGYRSTIIGLQILETIFFDFYDGRANILWNNTFLNQKL